MLDTVKPEVKRKRALPQGLKIRMADDADIPALLPLALQQFETSTYASFGVEYSEPAVEKYLNLAIGEALIPYILAVVGDEVVGYICFSLDATYSKKPVAVLGNFFVVKKYRRTLIGRLLMDAAINLAREDQACAFFAPVNNGGANIISLSNLLGKAGFRLSGYIMSREI